MEEKNFFKDKKILVVVLGAYGGGVATAKWLLKRGAKVSVTDFRTEKELAASLQKFTSEEKRKITFILGGQHEEDFVSADLIVAGPGVPNDSPYLLAARKAGVLIENEASIFFRYVSRPVIAVTGTRGKTTVTSWIAALLSQKYSDAKVCGNSQTGSLSESNPLLQEIDRKADAPVVAELSSWQLEYVKEGAPRIALITNIFPDHLNRYGGSMEAYARAKANIFSRQTPNDVLILNGRNPWTKFFLAQNPRAKVFFFSAGVLPQGKDGVFVRENALWFRRGKKEKKLFDVREFAKEWGKHNLENLAAAVLAVLLFDSSIRFTQKTPGLFRSVPFRQEIIKREPLTIVNDSAATSPDAVSAALKRFCKGKKPCVLITGGTDKDLDFSLLAKDMKKHIPSDKVVFLNGTATQKLLRSLFFVDFFGKSDQLKVFETLEECFPAAKASLPAGKGTILFSPGAASFEKFKNEFDRGERFNTAALS